MADFYTLDDVRKMGSDTYSLADVQAMGKTAEPSFASKAMDAVKGAASNFVQGNKDLAAGAVRGAGSIGATIVAPWDMAQDALAGKGVSLESNRARRKTMDDALQGLVGANPDSVAYGAGKLGAEVAGTMGLGGLLARPLAGVAPELASAISSGGFTTGANVAPGIAAGAKDLALRAAGGAISGGAMAGAVNPEDAPMGAMIGGALPVVTKAAGLTGSAIRNGIAGGGVSPEVKALAQRADELGINIPADRLVNSRPLNALASSLNYVPLSGRAATEDAMNAQLNTALSKTFGQDSSNVTMALRKAQDKLGGEFERTLSNNGVKFDKQLLEDVSNVYNRAESELGSDALKPIAAKINQMVEKGASGTIDGQAAYNIKRDLDRIGNSNNPNAWHAIELKQKLMDALNRSLGPEQAAAFAQTRQQYGNMLALEKLAKNGAEGEISAARLGNMKNINNEPLQELADIAAQFVKPREGAHGAAQRVFGASGVMGGAGGLGALIGGPVGAAVGVGVPMAMGRTANTVLNSGVARNILLGNGLLNVQPEALGLLTQGAYRSAPLLGGSR